MGLEKLAFRFSHLYGASCFQHVQNHENEGLLTENLTTVVIILIMCEWLVFVPTPLPSTPCEIWDFLDFHTTTREALSIKSESNLVSSFIWGRTYIIANRDSRALLAGSKLAAAYVNCDFLDWSIEHLSSSVVEVVVVDSKPIPAIHRNYSNSSVSISLSLELP